MGSYELDEEVNELHYTGDGWHTIKISDKEIKLLKESLISGYDLFNDGREVY